jgi:hypothetical protein
LTKKGEGNTRPFVLSGQLPKKTKTKKEKVLLVALEAKREKSSPRRRIYSGAQRVEENRMLSSKSET